MKNKYFLEFKSFYSMEIKKSSSEKGGEFFLFHELLYIGVLWVKFNI